MNGAPQLTFAEFWPHYLAEHSRPATRGLHLAATLAWGGLMAAGLWTRTWWLLALIPVAAYGLAWFSHFVVERNRPATFGHPLLSLAADHKMAYLMLTGRMGRELERLGGTPPPPPPPPAPPPAPPAPAAAPPAPPAPAEAPFPGRAGFVDDEVAAQEVLAVQGIDGLLGLVVVHDLDETEAAGLAGVAVADQSGALHRNPGLLEKAAQLFFGGLIGDVADIKLLHGMAPSPGVAGR